MNVLHSFWSVSETAKWHHVQCSKWLAIFQVAYIDTEGTFRAEKIRAIAARFDLDADAVLDNVILSAFSDLLFF